MPDLYTAVAPAQLRTQPRPETLLTSLITSLERPTLNRVDRIVTLSQGMVEAIRTIGVKTPLAIIPPTVDDILIRPLPERPGPFTALYSGNVGRKQGLDQLLDLAECQAPGKRVTRVLSHDPHDHHAYAT